MKKLIVLLLSMSCFCGVKAQHAETSHPTVRITGKIIDSATHQPIQYATITLYSAKATKAVGGMMTGNKGEFAIEAPRSGSYTLTIECIGYKTRRIGPFPGEERKTGLGDIPLAIHATEQQAAVVTAPRGLIENKLDKIVYNAEKDITSIGGVATDVLKKVPMVSVDVDGNVDIMGNTNILFLINGRPSSIFGNNLSDALQSIPASQIKSIEVITSPGAKYDAEGTGGIINIILKDNRINGVNGNLSLTGGSRLQNGSFNFNARHGKFGLNSFFSGNAQLPSTTLNSSNRNSYDSTGEMLGSLSQDGSSRFVRNGYETGLNLEWDPSKYDVLSGGLQYNSFGNNNRGSYLQSQTDYAPPATAPADQINSLVTNNSQFRARSLDWNLRYKRTFPVEDRELDFSVDGTYGHNTASYGQLQSLPAGDSAYEGSTGSSSGHDRETNIRLDYTEPFGEKVRLETGARVQLRQITSNSPVYSYDEETGLYPYNPSQSDSLTYNRHVYAGYVSMTFPAFHFLDVKAGMRFERTTTAASFSEVPDTYIPPYNSWVPSIILSHSFPHDQTLKISFARRLERPDYRTLNPYTNASDPKNLSRGNPLLQPEDAYNFELGYAKSFDQGSALNVVAFYHRSDHDIQPFIQYYSSFTLGDSVYTDVAVTTPMNIGSENNYGMNIYGSVPVGKKLNLRTNISVFDRYIVTGTLGGPPISSFNYRVNLNASYQLSPTFIAEFFGNFRSARNEIQGRYPSFTTYNVAMRKQFWNKKGSIALTVTNPIGKYVNQETAVKGAGFTLNSLRQIPFRSIGINFTWKFGKLEFKKDKDDQQKDIPTTPEGPGGN
ncbi:MAG TPA: outer membrane beta-barrel protein [Puia sp.]|nr:outer membrane beta-barrel protein [Puia sp.]